MAEKRLFIDILTLARASGHADGIVRTLRELARYAAEHRLGTTFVVHDPISESTRLLQPQWVPRILAGTAKVDTSDFPDPHSRRSRFRQSLPPMLRTLAMWIGRPRRRAFLALERLRLTGARGAGIAEGLQARLLNDKYRRELAMRDGGRRALVPFDMVVGEKVAFAEGDVLVLAGSDWVDMQQQIESAAMARCPHTVVMCYDAIPLLFPQFFFPANARSFRDCFHTVFARADLVIFNAGKIAADAERYCADHQLRLRKTAVVRLGADFDPVAVNIADELPAGLQAGRYALFVSTIEPRKGHAVLFRVWKRLLAAGIPQAHGFKLVFVGRQGWLVEDLMAELKADPCVGDSLVMLSNVDDGMLSRLYSEAAFCLYPSLYEGFGLPVIEAFRYGKAVISSDGGALPETVGRFSPIVAAGDDNAWFDMFALWIKDPSLRQAYENLIRTEFQPRGWTEAAGEFFAVVDRNLDQAAE